MRWMAPSSRLRTIILTSMPNRRFLGILAAISILRCSSWPSSAVASMMACDDRVNTVLYRHCSDKRRWTIAAGCVERLQWRGGTAGLQVGHVTVTVLHTAVPPSRGHGVAGTALTQGPIWCSCSPGAVASTGALLVGSDVATKSSQRCSGRLTRSRAPTRRQKLNVSTSSRPLLDMTPMAPPRSRGRNFLLHKLS